MGKGLIIAAVAGVLIIGAVAAYLTVGKSSTSSTSVSTSTESVQPQPTGSTATQSRSLKDLLTLGQNQTCTFEDETGSSGSVYVSSNRVRGDFVSNLNGKLENSHIIVDGQTAHFWADSLDKGFKISLSAMTDVDTTSTQQSVDIDKKVDYECRPWTVDASLFVLPATVEFSDFSSMMAPAVTGTSSAPDSSSQCAACQNLTGASRTQCLQALSCN